MSNPPALATMLQRDLLRLLTELDYSYRMLNALEATVEEVEALCPPLP